MAGDSPHRFAGPRLAAHMVYNSALDSVHALLAAALPQHYHSDCANILDFLDADAPLHSAYNLLWDNSTPRVTGSGLDTFHAIHVAKPMHCHTLMPPPAVSSLQVILPASCASPLAQASIHHSLLSVL